MCGICGIVEASGRRMGGGLLARIADTLRHRGPDDEGLWCAPNARVGLAHLVKSRLARSATD